MLSFGCFIRGVINLDGMVIWFEIVAFWGTKILERTAVNKFIPLENPISELSRETSFWFISMQVARICVHVASALPILLISCRRDNSQLLHTQLEHFFLFFVVLPTSFWFSSWSFENSLSSILSFFSHISRLFFFVVLIYFSTFFHLFVKSFLFVWRKKNDG